MKIKVTYAQVKEALAKGVISPLNSLKKAVKKSLKAPSFKTGKLRKNSMKKINWLLDNAKSITGESMSRRLDDCFESNGYQSATKKDVLDWIADRGYSSYTNLWLTCDENNNPIKFDVNGSHWESSFVIEL